MIRSARLLRAIVLSGVLLIGAAAPGACAQAPTATRTSHAADGLIFEDPVARTVVRMRHTLIREPQQRFSVVHKIDLISENPDRLYQDVTIYTALRVARWRLVYDVSEAASEEVAAILWDVALSIETHRLIREARRIRAAHNALLGTPAADAESDRLYGLMKDVLKRLESILEAVTEVPADE